MPDQDILAVLKRLSPEARLQMYQNARERIDKGGQAIMDAIDASGLPLREGPVGGTAKFDPVYLRMEEIIWSAEGRKAAIEATDVMKKPAMALVDPLLQSKLGDAYRPDYQITVSAGSIVGELMRHLGYVTKKAMPVPEGYIAKTAAMWEPKSLFGKMKGSAKIAGDVVSPASDVELTGDEENLK